MEKEKITIENLAGMVQRGFSGIEGRLSKLEEGQNKILQKLEGVDRERIDGINASVKNFENIFAMPAKK